MLGFRRAVMDDPEIGVKIIGDLRQFANDVVSMACMAGYRILAKTIAGAVYKDFYRLLELVQRNRLNTCQTGYTYKSSTFKVICLFRIGPNVTVARKPVELPGCRLPGKEDSAIVGWLLNILPNHGRHLPDDSGRIEKVAKRSICVEILGKRVAVVGDEVQVR